MKRKLAFILTGIIVISSLAGCGKSSQQSSSETKEKSEASEETIQYLPDINYSDYIKLCEYKGLEGQKVLVSVTEEEIQEEAENRIYDYATYDPITDRGIQDGDYVVLNYTATMDGKESADYSRDEEEVQIGEGFLYPELEKALEGMKTGESKTVEVKLTEDFAVSEEDVGKTLSVKVKAGAVTVENLPEYNDAFVKENTEYDSVKDYEAALEAEIKASKEEEYKYGTVGDMMGSIVEMSEFNGYPDELYARCEENYNSSNESNAAMFGMEVSEYLELMGVDENAKKEEIEANVNYELVIGSIAKQEGLECTEQEVDEFVKANFEDYGYEDEAGFLEEYTKEEIGYEIIYSKVIDLLYENAKLTEVSEEEYMEEHGDSEEEEMDIEE